jgi:hypothetical protein
MSEKVKRLIPIYDASAPIACTLSDAERPERVATLDRLRSSMTAIERTPTGLLLRFPTDADVRADVDAFAIDEKRCCQFWGFAVIDDDSGLALRWDGPPSVDEILDRLQAWFASDQPTDALSGLL